MLKAISLLGPIRRDILKVSDENSGTWGLFRIDETCVYLPLIPTDTKISEDCGNLVVSSAQWTI